MEYRPEQQVVGAGKKSVGLERVLEIHALPPAIVDESSRKAPLAVTPEPPRSPLLPSREHYHKKVIPDPGYHQLAHNAKPAVGATAGRSNQISVTLSASRPLRPSTTSTRTRCPGPT